MLWARKGTRPLALNHTGYDWVYLYGAVLPSTGENVGMVAGSVGIEWVNVHRRWISGHAREGPAGELVHVVLIMGQANWHTSKRLNVPSNITLLFQPSYSPELNPARTCGIGCAATISPTASAMRGFESNQRGLQVKCPVTSVLTAPARGRYAGVCASFP